MKIAFVVGEFPVLSQTFVINQVTGLLDRGHEVLIYTKRFGDWCNSHPDVARYGLKERTFKYFDVPSNYFWRIVQGVGLFILNFHRNPGLILRALNISTFGLQVARLWLLYSAISLSRMPNDFDIVLCQFGTFGFQGWIFQQMMDLQPKLVLMFRGHDISSFVREKGEQIYDDLFPAADICLTNCEFFRQRIIQLGCPPEKVAVHYSGLDMAKFSYHSRQPNSDGSIRLITTGRLVEKKGIEYAIRAIAQIAPQYPQIRYTIIGDGPLRSEFETLIKQLGLTDNVQLLGWQSEQALIDSLNQAHLFIAPSVTAADGNQDAPINVLKEAMAMGIPVVSTYHGGIPELVEDGVSGYLVPERDIEALAERLRWLLDEPERWPEMGRAGRAAVEQNFDLTHLNDLLVARYQALLQSAPPPVVPALSAIAP